MRILKDSSFWKKDRNVPKNILFKDDNEYLTLNQTQINSDISLEDRISLDTCETNDDSDQDEVEDLPTEEELLHANYPDASNYFLNNKTIRIDLNYQVIFG